MTMRFGKGHMHADLLLSAYSKTFNPLPPRLIRNCVRAMRSKIKFVDKESNSHGFLVFQKQFGVEFI